MTQSDTQSPFEVLLQRAQSKGRPVILDGAVGTELDNRGMDTRAPLWSGLAPLDHPSLLKEIHMEYASSGAEILTASTFRTTQRVYQRSNQPSNRWREAVWAAVSIARRAAGIDAVVAGSIAPLEDCFMPELAPSGREAEDAHSLLCRELVSAGVDILWLETFGTLGELKAAVSAAKGTGEPCGIPFAVSVTTNASGDLISKEPLQDAMAIACKQGAAAFSINCIPPRHVEPALSILIGKTDMPIGVYANLGFAEGNQDWEGGANLSPRAYAEQAAEWTRAGVSIIGGCCGSTPAHIKALSE